MTLHSWSGGFAAAVSLAAVLAILLQLRRRRECSWRWWAIPTFILGWLLAVAAVLSPLDERGAQGSLTAHIVQHVVLGDLAAPLLLIGLPPALGAAARQWYMGRTSTGKRGGRSLELTLSPAGALVLWAIATYVWLLPPVHRLAILDGPGHFLDHISFLAFGLLVWLPAFDFRPSAAVDNWETLKPTLTRCGLPWWARHVYAMVSRLAMLPAVAMLWLVPTSAYYLSAAVAPGGLTQKQDQVRAASLMLGFEIVLSALAVVLAFIWVSVSEGRARDRQGLA